MKILISLFTLIMTFNSCDSSKKAIENNSKMQETLSGTYIITQIEDNDVSSNKLVVTFDDGSNKITGFAGCNSFFGNYTIENNTITFTDISSSKKLCQPNLMNIENHFLKSLNSVNSFSITENVISFLDNDSILIEGNKSVLSSKKSTIDKVNYKTAIKYQALTRGSFDFILISESNIKISKDKDLQKINTYQIDTKDWEELNNLIESLDVETINTLEPPSKQHQFDGAAHATLAIQIGDVEYMTPTFDHGNPPKAIEALVNKVLSLKENTVKQ